MEQWRKDARKEPIIIDDDGKVPILPCTRYNGKKKDISLGNANMIRQTIPIPVLVKVYYDIPPQAVREKGLTEAPLRSNRGHKMGQA